MWAPQGASGPGARRGPKRVSTQRGRPGARAARAPAPPRGPPNGGENVSKTRARRRRAVRRPGARMRLLDGRGWRPSMTAGELEVPRRRREELAAGRGKIPQPEPTGGPGYGATGVVAARRDRSRGRPGADQVRRQSLQGALVSGATEVGARKYFQERVQGNISEVAARKAVAQGPQRAPVKGRPETRAGQGPGGGLSKAGAQGLGAPAGGAPPQGPRAGRGPEGPSQGGSEAKGALTQQTIVSSQTGIFGAGSAPEPPRGPCVGCDRVGTARRDRSRGRGGEGGRHGANVVRRGLGPPPKPTRGPRERRDRSRSRAARP